MTEADIELVNLDDNTVRMTNGAVYEIEYWEDDGGDVSDEPIDAPAAVLIRLSGRNAGRYARIEIPDLDACHIIH